MNLFLVVLALWLLPTLVFLLTALVAVPCMAIERRALRLFRREGDDVARSARL